MVNHLTNYKVMIYIAISRVIIYVAIMIEGIKPTKRCPWSYNSPLMIEYHDKEWGVPVHDDRTLFEFLTLEGAQAGLNWEIILKKREGFRRAFDNFDPLKISRYTDKEVNRLLSDPGIIRNRLKIQAAIINAQKFIDIHKEFGSFDAYIWRYTDERPIRHDLKSLSDYPTRTRESDTMSKDLQKRGFKFVGPTICYAFMQAVGMVNDHTIDCFRYRDITSKSC